MKAIKYFLFAISVGFVVAGCCTKKECGLVTNDIILHNFDTSDLDTVLIYEYERASNFTNPIDSLRLSVGFDSYTGNYLLYNYTDLDNNRSYRIHFKSPALDYRISDMTTTRRGCNSCFPYRPASDYYTIRTSYRINGKLKNSGVIEIEK